MNILVVEDEAAVARRVCRLTKSILGSQISHLNQVCTLEEADLYLQKHAIDLLLLDLNLNGKEGFQLLKSQLAQAFHTIVISAYADRALEAFEHGVLDFVSKPFSESRLSKALARFKESRPSQDYRTKFLAVSKRRKIELVPLDQIDYIQGAGPYSEIFVQENILLHQKSLDRLLQILPNNYERIHKRFIVNMNRAKCIHRYEGSRYELELDCGQRLPIGRSRYKGLLSKMS